MSTHANGLRDSTRAIRSVHESIAKHVENRFLRIYPRAPARLTRDLYLGERDLYLVRLIDPSYRFLQRVERELSHAVTDPGSIPPRPAAGLNPGRRCFAPVSLDRPICTASLFRSGKLGDWRLRWSADRSLDRSIRSSYRQNRSRPRDRRALSPIVPIAGVAVVLIIKISSTKGEKTAKKSPAVSLGKNGPFRRAQTSKLALLRSLSRKHTGPRSNSDTSLVRRE